VDEEFLSVKNWSEYQHYRDRCPPWIKLHTKILNDRKFAMLSCASRGLLMQLWILASEKDGTIPNDLNEIKFRLRDNTIKQTDVNLLIEKGFLNGCKQVQADASKCKQTLPRDRDRDREEKNNEHFDIFWQAYPRKIGKKPALKIWNKLNPSEELVRTILKAIEAQKETKNWKKDNGQFIPHPSTWLNNNRWEDEIHDETPMFR